MRQASRLADERATAAEEAETNARNALDESLSSLDSFLAERDATSTELEEAQAELVEQRPESAEAMGIEADDAAPAGPAGQPDAERPSAESEAEGSAPEAAAESESIADSESDSAPEPAEAEPAEQEESSGDTPAAETETAGEESTESEPEIDSESAPAEGGLEAEAATESEGSSAVTAEEAPEAPEAPAAPSLEDFDNPDTVQSALDAFAQAVGESQAEHTSFEDPYADSSENSDGESDSEGIAAPSSSENANESVAETDEQEGTSVAEVLPEVDDEEQVSEKLRGGETASDSNREQQIEAVIARAESQIGTPYVWGGGDANGATMGLDGQGYNGQAGFDCSGLVLYAYSGAGISLPHYTGYQYQRGTQIPVDEAERGDLLFWGNRGNQHVAIYLGDGMMLEAPQTGMNVQKTAVRRSGMAPMAVRLI